MAEKSILASTVSSGTRCRRRGESYWTGRASPSRLIWIGPIKSRCRGFWRRKIEQARFPFGSRRRLVECPLLGDEQTKN
jgi:hypothetical protein